MRSRAKRALNVLYRPSFSLEVMVKLTKRVEGHLVTLTEVSMHPITCISRHKSQRDLKYFFQLLLITGFNDSIMQAFSYIGLKLRKTRVNFGKFEVAINLVFCFLCV